MAIKEKTDTESSNVQDSDLSIPTSIPAESMPDFQSNLSGTAPDVKRNVK